MYNFEYRYAVRNRPEYYRKFGRAAWVKRQAVSRKNVTKALVPTTPVRSYNLRASYNKRPNEDRYLDNLPFRMRVGKRPREEISYAESFLRGHPNLVKKGTSLLNWIWDHGGRLMARVPLKRRRRGQLRAGTIYEEI